MMCVYSVYKEYKLYYLYIFSSTFSSLHQIIIETIEFGSIKNQSFKLFTSCWL